MNKINEKIVYFFNHILESLQSNCHNQIVKLQPLILILIVDIINIDDCNLNNCSRIAANQFSLSDLGLVS